ncbi:MAG: hypothetical protein MUO58_06935, partial [Anaerolineales bacterium]|nr:hypothetical protein [Anaerolineales bacterium]
IPLEPGDWFVVRGTGHNCLRLLSSELSFWDRLCCGMACELRLIREADVRFVQLTWAAEVW